MKSMMMMPPKIAEPQLARDRGSSLEIGAEDRLFEIAVADVGAGVHVDRRHGLGLVEHDVAARLQRHLAVQRAADLVVDAVDVEDRPVLAVELDQRREMRHELLGEFLHLSA